MAAENMENNHDSLKDSLILNFQSLELDGIPSNLKHTELACVSELYLDYNSIKQINEDFCQKCIYLQKLSIIGNDLQCLPDHIGSLFTLKELYLNENNLESLPDNIQSCTQLSILNVVGNELKYLPKEIGSFKKLKMLYADENNLVGLPPSFGLLKSLETAELSNNRLEELPNNIGCLENLQILNLSNNKLKTLPESFGDLPCLKELDISDNYLTYITDSFSSRNCIRKFYADGNVIEVLPKWINTLSNVEILSVKDNRLRNEPLDRNCGKICDKLKNLNLAGNFITSLPPNIGELRSIEIIHLGSALDAMERRNFQNGNILWTLPESFTDLITLKSINLDENQLYQLPSQFGKLVNLAYLNLGQNRLQQLPDTFGHLRSLQICILSINTLESLPHNFGELQNLEELKLDNNKIAKLPKSFSKLSTLKTLDLFNNKLTEVPECVQHLTNLLRFDISENPLPMHHLRVPDKKVCHSYAPRDPSLKDNWRGRPRQDIVGLQIIEADVPGEDYGSIPEEPEPQQEQTTYNDHVLQRAVSRNLSLWKSHTDSNTSRQKVSCADDSTTKHLNGLVKSLEEVQRQDCKTAHQDSLMINGNINPDEDQENLDSGHSLERNKSFCQIAMRLCYYWLEYLTPTSDIENNDDISAQKHSYLSSDGLIPPPDDSLDIQVPVLNGHLSSLSSVTTDCNVVEDWDKECIDVNIADYKYPQQKNNYCKIESKPRYKKKDKCYIYCDYHVPPRGPYVPKEAVTVSGQFEDVEIDNTIVDHEQYTPVTL